MSQILEQAKYLKPKSLIERVPTKDRVKLSEQTTYSWEDLRGLTWVFSEDWS